MRLPEAKIKEALGHPEKLGRQEALLYFADCYSRDAKVMPLAIRVTEVCWVARRWAYSVTGSQRDDAAHKLAKRNRERRKRPNRPVSYCPHMLSGLGRNAFSGAPGRKQMAGQALPRSFFGGAACVIFVIA